MIHHGRSMPLRRRRIVAGLIAIAAAATGCQAIAPRSVSFTNAELASMLARRMPLRRSVRGILELELSQPVVALQEEQQRLAVTFDLSLRSAFLPGERTGQLTFSGIPRYDASSRSISLVEGAVDRLSVDGLPATLAGRLRELASRIAEDQFARNPIHTLDPDKTRFGSLDLNPTAVRIEAGRLVVELAPR